MCPSGALEGASRVRGGTVGKGDAAARTPVKGEVMLNVGKRVLSAGRKTVQSNALIKDYLGTTIEYT